MQPQVLGQNGGASSYTFPVNGNTYSDVIPAPGAPGTYTVTSTFAPTAGSSLGPSTSAPTTLTVSAGLATIVEAVSPNPATPNGAETVTGTVTAGGSPGAGTVQLYVSRFPSDPPGSNH